MGVKMGCVGMFVYVYISSQEKYFLEGKVNKFLNYKIFSNPSFSPCFSVDVPALNLNLFNLNSLLKIYVNKDFNNKIFPFRYMPVCQKY